MVSPRQGHLRPVNADSGVGRKEVSAISGFSPSSPAPRTLHRSQLHCSLRGHHGDALCYAPWAPGALLLLWPLGVKVQPLHGHCRFWRSGAPGTHSPEDLGRSPSPALGTFAFFSPTLQISWVFPERDCLRRELQLWPGHHGLPKQECIVPELGSQKYRTKPAASS